MANGELHARVAIVTGGGSGIGAATCLALAAAGARVVVADIASDAAERTADQIRRREGQALAVRADVADPVSVSRMAQTVHDAWGRVSILVNNAGVCPTTPLLEISLDEWNEVLAVNLTGVLLCSQAVLPDMMEDRWGRIVNVSSMGAQVGGIITGAHYVASKGGILALTKSIARFGAPYGITANNIAPGTVETPMRDALGDAAKERLIGAAIIRRAARPDEIAAGVLYLIGDKASYITGQTLNINGGAFLS
ncbi:MAG: 3-oxoacyl-ACP reductase FabG [Anaerolineae bacterium]|nr:3-oxoacyl-ACP reductase FabG [Anaerolineae bacterium]